MINRWTLRALALIVDLKDWVHSRFVLAPHQVSYGDTDLNKYERRFMSQHGEDGIVAEIVRRIQPSDKFFVECGVGDGLQANTSYLAMFAGWSGVMIEAGERDFQRLERNYRRTPKVSVAPEPAISRELSSSNIMGFIRRRCGGSCATIQRTCMIVPRTSAQA